MTVAIAPAAERRRLDAPRDLVALVDVPKRRYLAVDGFERPGGQTFQNGIATLYPIAYALHFLLRKSDANVPVGTLEALYWTTPGDGKHEGETDTAGHDAWSWRLLIPVPEVATEEDVERAIRDAANRRTLPALSRLHVVQWHEGRCAQLLHVGPYAAEPETVARLHEAIGRAGLVPCGPHHEIYLNDPNQVGMAKAKTMLRLAVRPRVAGGPGGSD